MGNYDDGDILSGPQLPKKVEPSLPIPPVLRKDGENREKKSSDQKKGKPREEVKDHFKELSYAVEQIHKILTKNKSPFRFCVYEEEGNIMIDIVRLDDKGEVARTEQKNITHESFIKLVRSIESGEGLLFDFNA